MTKDIIDLGTTAMNRPSNYRHILAASKVRHTDVHRVAGVLLVTKDGRMIGHLRDDKPGIDSPGMVAIFGGGVEDGELPVEAAARELAEETNLHIPAKDLIFVASYVSWRPLKKEYENFSFYVAHVDNVDNLQVYEGQSWYEIKDINDPKITHSIMPGLNKWVNLNN